MFNKIIKAVASLLFVVFSIILVIMVMGILDQNKGEETQALNQGVGDSSEQQVGVTDEVGNQKEGAVSGQDTTRSEEAEDQSAGTSTEQQAAKTAEPQSQAVSAAKEQQLVVEEETESNEASGTAEQELPVPEDDNRTHDQVEATSQVDEKEKMDGDLKPESEIISAGNPVTTRQDKTTTWSGSIVGFDCAESCLIKLRQENGTEIEGSCGSQELDCGDWTKENPMPVALVASMVDVTVAAGSAEQADKQYPVYQQFDVQGWSKPDRVAVREQAEPGENFLIGMCVHQSYYSKAPDTCDHEVLHTMDNPDGAFFATFTFFYDEMVMSIIYDKVTRNQNILNDERGKFTATYDVVSKDVIDVNVGIYCINTNRYSLEGDALYQEAVSQSGSCSETKKSAFGRSVARGKVRVKYIRQ